MNVIKFFQNFLSLAILLSLPRWIGILIYNQYFSSVQDIVTNAFIGIRFDLLVMSFLLLPLLLFIAVNIRRKMDSVKYLNFVILLVWIFISGVYFFNFLHLNVYQDLIWSQNWGQVLSLLLASSVFEIIGALLMAGVIFYIGFQLSIKIRRILLVADLRSRIVIFLILAFFARGSLGKDHLRRNDCDGRANSVVRALCLNPVYVFSKVKNQEFGP